MNTPRLTRHARERCEEMGISTRVAKRIVQHADIRYPAQRNGTAATSKRHPEYTVIYVVEDGVPIILTVVFRTTEQYVRAGNTFIPATQGA